MVRRIFLALPVPSKIKNQLGEASGKIKKQLSDWQINWVPTRNLHITLIFFGWVEEKQLEILKKEIATEVRKFIVSKVSTGQLNTQNRPIWFEIEKGQEELTHLQISIAKRLTIKGSEESRSFRPHITIGRVKKRGKSKSRRVEESFSWKVDRLVLYESKLTREGSSYRELLSVPLGK